MAIQAYLSPRQQVQYYQTIFDKQVLSFFPTTIKKNIWEDLGLNPGPLVLSIRLWFLGLILVQLELTKKLLFLQIVFCIRFQLTFPQQERCN